MVFRRNGGSATEKLVAESERLRHQLMRAAGKLEAFAGELMEEAQVLKGEAAPDPEGDDHERGDDSAGPVQGQ